MTQSHSEVVALAEALIRLATPNPPGEERTLAEFLAADLRHRGVAAEVLPVAGAGTEQANVFARVPGRGEGPPLVFSGHLDTVPAGEGTWTRDPWTPTIESGRLYGLGASDMKAAVAAMVLAGQHFAGEAKRGHALPGDLLLAFTSSEETGSFGARSLTKSGLLEGAAGLVIGEPTSNRVGIAEKGGLWLEVVMHGRTSHGSLPHLGANAIAGLAEVVVELEHAAGGDTKSTPLAEDVQELRELREALRRPAHDLLGAPTFTVTRVGGGLAMNVVPDHASAVFDIRTLPGQSAASIRTAVRRIAERVAAARGLRAAVVDLGERVALDTPRDHPLIACCEAAVKAVLGTPAEVCALTGATDATELVPALHIPFVICGPGDMAQAHQPDEFVALDALAASVEIYRELARRFWK